MIATSEIINLPIEERLKLVELIWDSIAKDSAGPPLTEAKIQGLDRRRTRGDGRSAIEIESPYLEQTEQLPEIRQFLQFPASTQNFIDLSMTQ